MLFLSLYIIVLGCVLTIIGTALDSEYIAVPGVFCAVLGLVYLLAYA